MQKKKSPAKKTAKKSATTKGKKVTKLSKDDLKNLKGGGPVPARCCTYAQK